jgi:hypothetical protein
MTLTPEQKVWFDVQTKSPEMLNPCVRLYGLGPEGERCKNCTHLFARHMGNTYWKCDLRKCTRGPGSDHRVNWPACGKFERKPE